MNLEINKLVNRKIIEKMDKVIILFFEKFKKIYKYLYRWVKKKEEYKFYNIMNKRKDIIIGFIDI